MPSVQFVFVWAGLTDSVLINVGGCGSVTNAFQKIFKGT